LFSGKNNKAVGICYANIGNLHYRNEKYSLAADSFTKAIKMASVNLNEISIKHFYRDFPNDRPA
jgi:hypothetical protein